MIKKDDWKLVMDQMRAGDQLRLGDLPEFSELTAYFAGQLNDDGEERIREFLVAFPELRRVMSEPVITGEEGAVSDAELEAAWSDLQTAIRA